MSTRVPSHRSGGADTPRSDAFAEPVRRQSVKRIAGAEVLVGSRTGSIGAATEDPCAADRPPEMRLTGLRAASRGGVSNPPALTRLGQTAHKDDVTTVR